MKITLTQLDIENAKLQNSPSGMLIDELAYSAGEWTSEDLYTNNMEYEPYTPYDYNYEKDLFAHTQTLEQYTELCDKLQANMGSNEALLDYKKSNLQAGAYMALNYPEQWAELLDAYKEKLQEDRTDGISKEYNDQLQKEIDEYNKDQYNKWLYGDHRDYAGVIRMISKYYTGDYNNCKYIPHSRETEEACFIFDIDDEQLHDDYCGCNDTAETCTEKHDYKADLLVTISNAGFRRAEKDKAERAKRAEERAKTKEYQAKRKAQEKAERRAKLLAMTLNN